MNAIDVLRKTLEQPHCTAEYIGRRGAHPALGPYATLVELLDALGASSPLGYPERHAIVFALITEHRRAAGHPLWQSLLLVTYGGMLGNVRRRIFGGEPEENEQRTLLAFLEAVERVPLESAPSPLSLYLRHATERGAFFSASRHGEPEVASIEEAAGEIDPRDPVAAIEHDSRMGAIMRELCALFGDADVAREALDVLLHARTGRKQLEEYIHESYPGLRRAERAAVYTRLQRLRARALARLENRFERGFTKRALRSD